MFCGSSCCGSVKQTDRACTIECLPPRLAARSSTQRVCGSNDCVDACQLPDCEQIRYRLADCEGLKYMSHGCEAWDPLGDMPGLEMAALARRRNNRKKSASHDFSHLVRLLDLKRCPNCGTDWTRRDEAEELDMPLLDGEDTGPYSRPRQAVIFYDGTQYCTPFTDLIGSVITMCPFCPPVDKIRHPADAQRPLFTPRKGSASSSVSESKSRSIPPRPCP